jgi:hypothetical protein
MKKRQVGIPVLPDLPPSTAEEKTKVDPIEEMVGALTDPIIVYPSGWEQDLPERLKDELPLHRLAHLMKCSQGLAKWDEACDLEALLYLFPASLSFPLDAEWTDIYLYLSTKVMGDKVPQDIKRESLPDHYLEELRRLKRWIHDKKLAARKERMRQEKKEEREEKEKKTEVKPEIFEQLKMPGL